MSYLSNSTEPVYTHRQTFWNQMECMVYIIKKSQCKSSLFLDMTRTGWSSKKNIFMKCVDTLGKLPANICCFFVGKLFSAILHHWKQDLPSTVNNISWKILSQSKRDMKDTRNTEIMKNTFKSLYNIHHHHDDIIKWKHFLHYWPFVCRIHRTPVNSPMLFLPFNCCSNIYTRPKLR